MAGRRRHAERLPGAGTSIPGVAQRTGATTYYVEIFPRRAPSLGGREPVFSLTPSPGNVDVMVASELIEAGRAMTERLRQPERTTLIASTHRIYAPSRRCRWPTAASRATRVARGRQALAQARGAFDMRKLAQESGTVINAVLFGAIAGSGVLPLPREACEAAIRGGGRGVEASLRGFAAGYDIARATSGAACAGRPAARNRAREIMRAWRDAAEGLPGRRLRRAVRAAHASHS